MTGTELTVHTTEIPGLLVLDLVLHGDERGWFKENWQRAKTVSYTHLDVYKRQVQVAEPLQLGAQALAVEDVVPQHEAALLTVDEVRADGEGLG